VRLTRLPVASIALIRGCATGNVSEITLARDMSFASREKTIISRWEVGARDGRRRRPHGSASATHSVFQSKDEPGGTEKARIVMAPLWVDLWKESSRIRKRF